MDSILECFEGEILLGDLGKNTRDFKAKKKEDKKEGYS